MHTFAAIGHMMFRMVQWKLDIRKDDRKGRAGQARGNDGLSPALEAAMELRLPSRKGFQARQLLNYGGPGQLTVGTARPPPHVYCRQV
jgi:hypothetical protein